MKSFFEQIKKATEEAVKKDLPESFISEHSCPKCSSNMIKKISKFDPSNVHLGQKCDGTLTTQGEDKSKVELDTGKVHAVKYNDKKELVDLEISGAANPFQNANTEPIIDENSNKMR